MPWDRFAEEQNFPPQTWLEEGVRTLCEKRIVLNLFCVRSSELNMDMGPTVREFRGAFANIPNGGDRFFTLDLKDKSRDFVEKVLTQVTTSMMASGAKKGQTKK